MTRMNTVIIISLILTIAIGCVILFFLRSKSISVSPDKRPFISKHEAEEFVNQLMEAGYYKYANPTDIDSLKAELISSIAEYGILSTLYYEDLNLPKDYRFYIFDNETIFEQGGFDEAFKDMKSLFDKMDFKFEITDHIEEWDTINKCLNHEITINGKHYVIFENFKDYGWCEAAMKYADIINDQLELQNKDERLYLINGANDGVAIFLKDKQFQLIDKLLTDDEWKPLTVDKWGEVFKVQRLPY
jgi:hypothetical protein